MYEFSVFIPVYNAQKYLSQCLDSLINQENLEIILVDDGSTDSSPEICNSYAEKHSFISVYHRKNSGPLESRRFGLSKAKGQWVIYLDSDDKLAPSSLSVLHSKITENPSVDCVIMGFERLSDGKTQPATDGVVSEDTLITDRRQLFRTVFLNANYNVIWRKVAKREKQGLEDLSQFYSERFGEDLIQSLEILKHCTSFLFIPDPLYQYRVNEESLTWTHNYSKNVSYVKEQQVLNFLKSEGVFTEEDYDDYCSFLCGWLSINLVEITLSHSSLKEKIKLFRQYNDNTFFNSFIVPRGKNRKTVSLLSERRYYSLMCYCILKKASSVIRRKPLAFF